MQVSKDFYALNLTDSQTDKLISKIEADVTIQLQQLQEKKEPLNEAEQYYLSIKSEYIKIEEELNDNKSLLEALVRFKKNPRGSKEIRVIRTTSNLESKERNQRYFRWVAMAMDILREKDRFLMGDELFRLILDSNPEIANSVGHDKHKLNAIKKTTLGNFMRSCEETRKNNRGKLIDYKNKFGLFEWMMDDFTPDPLHIKAFMHGNQNVEAKLYLQT